MKYTIHGFSQQKAIELELDDRDLMLLRWFVDYKDTGKMVKKIIDEEMFYWVKYEGIQEAFPIAEWKKDTIYRRLKAMSKIGILRHQTVKEGGVWSYYSLGPKYPLLLDTSGEISIKEVGKKSECSEKNPNQTDLNPEQNINLLYSSYKERKKVNNTYDEIIKSYTNNKELSNCIIEFIKMRKLIKAPMTDKALKLMLNKLDKLSNGNLNTKIALLNQSIENSWKGIFELKTSNKQQPTQPKRLDNYEESRNTLKEIFGGDLIGD